MSKLKLPQNDKCRAEGKENGKLSRLEDQYWNVHG